MNSLKNLQFEARKRLERLAEIRDLKIEYVSAEVRKELEALIVELENINKDIALAKKTGDIDQTFRNESSHEPLARQIPLDDHEGRSGTHINRSGNIQSAGRPGVRYANDTKEYRSLFGAPETHEGWRFNDQTFFEAVFSGRAHPGLNEARAMSESGGGAVGGYMVPSQESETIFNIALETELIMPKSNVIPMAGKDVTIPAFEIGNHSSSLFGGFSASFSAEAGTLADANPTMREMLLVAKKMYGFCKLSNELYSDIGKRSDELLSILGKGMGWFRDKYLINGSGAGEPQGLRNAPSKIVIAKENGQASGTLIYDNLAKMLSRLNPGSIGRACWIASPTTLPALLTLSIPIGTSGSHIPVLTGTPGRYSCLLMPIYFTEHLPILGAEDDILITDLSQYVVGLRKDISVDLSGHIFFQTDQMAVRLISRYDGQSLWSQALTLSDNVTTVSPIVSLAVRA